MNLTTEERRALVKMAYCEDKTWFDKVDRMPNLQVYAIFHKMKMDGKIAFCPDGKIYFRSDEEVKELKKKRYESHCGHQITIDEFFGEDIIEKGEKN